MNDMLESLVSDMDEEQAMALLDNLDDEQVAQTAGILLNKYVVPHLADVRQRAINDDSPQHVRDYYANLSQQEKEETFYNAVENLAATLVECRESPQTGFPKLKSQLRDPYTTEAFLLMMDDDEHVDPQYTREWKELLGQMIRWVGALTVPEMYTEQEVQSVLEEFDANPDASAANEF